MRKSHPDLPTYHQHRCSNKKRVGTGNAVSRRRSIFAEAASIAVIGIGVLVIAYLFCPPQVLIAQDAPPQEQTQTDGEQTPDTPDETPTDVEQSPDATDETPTDVEQSS